MFGRFHSRGGTHAPAFAQIHHTKDRVNSWIIRHYHYNSAAPASVNCPASATVVQLRLPSSAAQLPLQQRSCAAKQLLLSFHRSSAAAPAKRLLLGPRCSERLSSSCC